MLPPFSQKQGETHRRVPYPFAIIDLRSSLRSIRKKLPAGIDPQFAVTLPRKSISSEYPNDYYDYSDPRVSGAEVILADIQASRLDYKWNSWKTEYVLGWIAYREIDKFRLPSLPNLAAAASDEERRLGVKHIHPDAEVLMALRQGRLIARPLFEVMHLGYPNPIPSDWWKDRTLTDAPHLRFVKQDVISLWTADGSAPADVAPDIRATRDGSTRDFVSAATVDPWAPLENLTAGERRVLIEAKRHWPNCRCLLRVEEIYSEIIKNWDKAELGEPPREVQSSAPLRKFQRGTLGAMTISASGRGVVGQSIKTFP